MDRDFTEQLIVRGGTTFAPPLLNSQAVYTFKRLDEAHLKS